MTTPDSAIIENNVTVALEEDIGDGDLTAQLIDPETTARATLINREPLVLCGSAWATACFHRLDPTLELQWHFNDGDWIETEQPLLTLRGQARPILSAERSAINFLQTLSGVATTTRNLVRRLQDHPKTTLLDTRKTLPGLRMAQKYAVRCGGGHNHRMGLYDAFLIKENHIAATGSIATAVERAHAIAPGRSVEVEVENLEELQQALAAGADTIMLDNFTLPQIATAVETTAGRAALEVSGSVPPEQLQAIAATGVDTISLGALTKHIHAIDLSLRVVLE